VRSCAHKNTLFLLAVMDVQWKLPVLLAVVLFAGTMGLFSVIASCLITMVFFSFT